MIFNKQICKFCPNKNYSLFTRIKLSFSFIHKFSQLYSQKKQKLQNSIETCKTWNEILTDTFSHNALGSCSSNRLITQYSHFCYNSVQITPQRGTLPAYIDRAERTGGNTGCNFHALPIRNHNPQIAEIMSVCARFYPPISRSQVVNMSSL